MTEQELDKKSLTPPKLIPALEVAPRLEPPVLTEPEVTPSKTVKFGMEHSDFATFHEGYVRHYIALADTKASVIFALAAGIIGYFLNKDEVRSKLLAPAFSCEFFIIIVTFLSLGLAATLTFFVFAPRLSTPSREGIVFFGAVAQKASSDEFLSEIADSSGEQITEARLKHCFDTSKICSRKYNLLKSAIWVTPISLVFSLSTLLVI